MTCRIHFSFVANEHYKGMFLYPSFSNGKPYFKVAIDFFYTITYISIGYDKHIRLQ
jgi:hypothetical protein